MAGVLNHMLDVMVCVDNKETAVDLTSTARSQKRAFYYAKANVEKSPQGLPLSETLPRHSPVSR